MANAQAEQIADEMEWEEVKENLHKAQLHDAYKQATDAFSLLGEAKAALNLVDITQALDGKLDQEVIDRVKAMVTKIDKFLASHNPE